MKQGSVGLMRFVFGSIVGQENKLMMGSFLKDGANFKQYWQNKKASESVSSDAGFRS